MRRLLSLALLATATAAPARHEPRRSPSRYALVRGPSRVWFEADATLGHFRGETAELWGWAKLDPVALGGAQGYITISAVSFETGNGIRDGDLRKAIEARRFPRITFALEGVAPAGAVAPDSVRITGTLTVRGVPHRMMIAAAVDLRGDTVHVAGRAPLRFTELNMEPPSRFLGAARVKDEMIVGFDALFAPETSS